MESVTVNPEPINPPEANNGNAIINHRRQGGDIWGEEEEEEEDANNNLEFGAVGANASNDNHVGNFNDATIDMTIIPQRMGPDDPRRMLLTTEERNWALEIKDAIELDPDLDNLSDFWYAQFAIVCQNDVDDAIQRAEGLQVFRQEYGVLDTYEQGRVALERWIQLLPNFYLSFGFNQEDGMYTAVMDGTKMSIGELSTTERLTAAFAGAYYSANAELPDMASIRNGLVSISECDGICSGMKWSQAKQDVKLIRALCQQLFSVYPISCSKIWFYNSSSAFNVVSSLTKKVLPENLRDKVRMGLKFPGGVRMDQVFLVPNAQLAEERVLRQFEATLQRRMDNEKDFSIDNDSCVGRLL